jgi:hypothetical protein
MKIGSRVLYPEEVGSLDAELLQISVYFGMKDNLEIMKECARACKNAGVRYVIHPVSYSLLKNETFKDVKLMAEWADIALILHDERTPEGGRIKGENEALFRNALEELGSIVTISFENATDTADVRWFWNNYADSITVDIGHIESSGIDSVEFVTSLDEATVRKIQFAHMHRNNGLHGGITDHWPLSHDCREIRALKELVKIRPDVSVILEINEVEEIAESLDILRELREELQA